MRARLQRWALTVALWLLRLAEAPVLAIPNDALLQSARDVVNQIQERDGREDAMWKQRQAFAVLLKRFPDASKRHVAHAIEVAVQLERP